MRDLKMNRYILSITINGYEDFTLLVEDISSCFNLSLTIKNDEGRLVARSESAEFKVEVIDKYDDLSNKLSDDNYVLDIYKNSYNIEQFIEKIKLTLNRGRVFWNKGVCISLNETDLNKNTFDFYP